MSSIQKLSAWLDLSSTHQKSSFREQQLSLTRVIALANSASKNGDLAIRRVAARNSCKLASK